jgi:regulator of sirC expression with transglutaminase-like and TPR domain
MNKKYTYLIVIFLIVTSGVAFGRIAGNDFINFDDNKYITENNHIKLEINKESFHWAFTTTYFSYWHPLTWLSHMLDWSLFGANASGHHLISLLLHIGSVILLFLFLNKTTHNLWPSAFAAAFFALHPLRVESVAWAAERKDVLSMFFGMSAIYAYAFYAENHGYETPQQALETDSKARGGVLNPPLRGIVQLTNSATLRFRNWSFNNKKLSRYFLCLILFALGLMSKPILVTLPFVLLLLDYWPLKRWPKETTGRLIMEKVPFLLLTIASCILTLWAQNKVGAVASSDVLPFLTRTANAIVSYTVYLGKIFWPVNLALFYPYDLSLPLWKVSLSGTILILVTFVVLYSIRKLPFLFVGWFWYLGTLVPVIGLIQAGPQAMADRHTYLPSVGIAVILAWGLPLLFSRDDTRRKILFPAAIAYLFILSILTWQQCGYWKNSIILFQHALQITKNNYLAHSNLASTLAEEEKFNEAVYHYNEAIRITPYYADDYKNRGNVYAKLGQYQLAIEDYNQAIRLQPDCADTYYGRGTIYGALGQYQPAIENLSEAIRLQPDYIYAYYNRGIAYFMQGRNKSGCSDLEKVCELGNCQALDLAKSRNLCH